MNYFINLNDAKLEKSVFRFIKYIMDINIQQISSKQSYVRNAQIRDIFDYSEGCVFILGHDFKQIKGESHIIPDGLCIIDQLKVKHPVIFYFASLKEIRSDYLVDLMNFNSLVENINKAKNANDEFFFINTKELLENTYKLTHH